MYEPRTIGSWEPLEASYHLKKVGTDENTLFRCIECGKIFRSGDGHVYPATYEKDGQAYFGLIDFCDLPCVLNHLFDNQVGHA